MPSNLKYEIASSSQEEGEVREPSFPYYKSYLQNYYYPLSTLFIGKNSVPNIINYKSEGICLKLKKELKNDYSYISFNVLDSHKPFFDNKFIKIIGLDDTSDEEHFNKTNNLLTAEDEVMIAEDDVITAEDDTITTKDDTITAEDINKNTNKNIKQHKKDTTEDVVEFLGVKGDYKEIKKLTRKTGYESRYDKFFQRFFFNKDETSSNYKRIFVLEDRVLEAIDCPTAYIFFRVVSTKEKGADTVKYIFEDVFYNRLNFYEYLEFYGENVLKTHCSEEIRTYFYRESIIFIHSSTTFINNSSSIDDINFNIARNTTTNSINTSININGNPKLRKLYNGPDYVKNTMILFNKDGPSFCNIQGRKNDNLKILLKMNLKEGDYVLNGKSIYKIGNEGEQVEFKGIEYEDFIKSVWDKLTE